MSSKYLQAIFYNHLNINEYKVGFVRRGDILSLTKREMTKYFRAHKPDFNIDLNQVSQEVWLDWVQFGVVNFEVDEFAGEYCEILLDELNKFRDVQLLDNPIIARAGRVGGTYLPSVLEGIMARGLEDDPEGSDAIHLAIAPGADRIVRFDDNQIHSLEEQTENLIKAVEELNQIEGRADLREIVVGQLRAGRELIRAGCFKLYLLEITLIQTLQFLAKRYEQTVIGALAGALITELLKHIGIGA